MPTKKPIESKSLWFNVLTIISLVGASLLADESFREIVGGYAIYFIIAVNIINMVIRVYTVKPLEIHKHKPPPILDPLEEALRKDAEELEEG